jgi:hypothetical protein
MDVRSGQIYVLCEQSPSSSDEIAIKGLNHPVDAQQAQEAKRWKPVFVLAFRGRLRSIAKIDRLIHHILEV